VETVRYYERRGLIEQPEKPAKGHRHYPQATLKRILFIKRAQELGFTLDEIANLLLISDSSCAAVQEITENKLMNVRDKIRDLLKLEAVLGSLLTQCAANIDPACCPVIESLLQKQK
jgi:MerR family mercuric resistance operon transcriptional regulator